MAKKKNQCSHKLATQNHAKFCNWHNHASGNVASKFQLKILIQEKAICVFVNLVNFDKLSRWTFISGNA